MHVHEAGGKRLVRQLAGRAAAGGQRPKRGAVVALVARDHFVLAGVAGLGVILPGQLERGFVGFRAAAGELDVREWFWCHLGQPLGQRDGRLGRRIERQGQGNAVELRAHRLDDALVPVSQLHRRDAGQAVDIPPTGVVANPDAVALDQHERVVQKRLSSG